MAQHILNEKKNVLFLNLDIRDYFHSVRLPAKEIFSGKSKKGSGIQYQYNLQHIFLKTHLIYTKKVGNDFAVPYDFSTEVNSNKTNGLEAVCLPIGLLSSYVLANHYLKKFDNNVLQKIRPAYYGRYVDDILIVIEAPKTGFDENDVLEELRFSFSKYKTSITKASAYNEKVTFTEAQLTNLEKFVLQNFYPILKLVDKPSQFMIGKSSKEKERYFKISGYKSLF